MRRLGINRFRQNGTSSSGSNQSSRPTRYSSPLPRRFSFPSTFALSATLFAAAIGGNLHSVPRSARRHLRPRWERRLPTIWAEQKREKRRTEKASFFVRSSFQKFALAPRTVLDSFPSIVGTPDRTVQNRNLKPERNFTSFLNFRAQLIAGPRSLHRRKCVLNAENAFKFSMHS